MKKLNLKELEVRSFVTDMGNDKVNTVKGGYITYACTAGWVGCPDGGGGGGGGSNSCEPNPWYTHRPCDTEAGNIHCDPC